MAFNRDVRVAQLRADEAVLRGFGVWYCTALANFIGWWCRNILLDSGDQA